MEIKDRRKVPDGSEKDRGVGSDQEGRRDSRGGEHTRVRPWSIPLAVYDERQGPQRKESQRGCGCATKLIDGVSPKESPLSVFI